MKQGEVQNFLKENTLAHRQSVNIKDNVELIEEKLNRYKIKRTQKKSDFSSSLDKNEKNLN